ncbi:MAG TPA: pyridoxal phosphate-dependent aminotransferase [Planctomycetota bacterium]|nr:pyridoxal phosphate-dependent aminotransferase [Planctomycetota bacterium]
MTVRLTDRIKAVKPSATLAVGAKAAEMKAAGIDVISFGAGEPDFDTPNAIKAAAKAAIDAGDTKYVAKRGKELLKNICGALKREIGLTYTPDQVLVSCGAKHSIYNLIQVLAQPGDEVVFQAPYWVSYYEMCNLAGATPVIVPTSDKNDFKMTPLSLEKALTKNTRAIIINSPSNPTGAVYTRKELEALAAVLEKSPAIVISDEMYNNLLYDGVEHWSIASYNKAFGERTVVVNGASKTFAMTGWRIGYMAGPKDIVKACANLQSHSTSDAASISQAAAAEAFTQPLPELAERLAEFDKRRRRMVELLNAIPGIQCRTPKGAFYAFPNVSGTFGRTLGGKTINSGMDFAAAALEQANVAVVPGEAFGDKNYIRLSYATSMKQIETGLDRLKKWLA